LPKEISGKSRFAADKRRALTGCLHVARAFQVTRIKVEWRDERFVKARRVNPKNFFAELKRRNVYKVAIAYAVVAWLLMQVASQIFRSSKFLTGLCVLRGFPSRKAN